MKIENDDLDLRIQNLARVGKKQARSELALWKMLNNENEINNKLEKNILPWQFRPLTAMEGRNEIN